MWLQIFNEEGENCIRKDYKLLIRFQIYFQFKLHLFFNFIPWSLQSYWFPILSGIWIVNSIYSLTIFMIKIFNYLVLILIIVIEFSIVIYLLKTNNFRKVIKNYDRFSGAWLALVDIALELVLALVAIVKI